MAVTDSIADLLTRIRNAVRVRMDAVEIPYSRLKEDIVSLLKEEGFIDRYEAPTKLGKKILKITLRYKPNKDCVIRQLRRISTPGRRVYVKRDKIPRVLSGFGLAIISTPKGIMTDSQARIAKLGGEVICHVY